MLTTTTPVLVIVELITERGVAIASLAGRAFRATVTSTSKTVSARLPDAEEGARAGALRGALSGSKGLGLPPHSVYWHGTYLGRKAFADHVKDLPLAGTTEVEIAKFLREHLD